MQNWGKRHAPCGDGAATLSNIGSDCVSIIFLIQICLFSLLFHIQINFTEDSM